MNPMSMMMGGGGMPPPGPPGMGMGGGMGGPPDPTMLAGGGQGAMPGGMFMQQPQMPQEGQPMTLEELLMLLMGKPQQPPMGTDPGMGMDDPMGQFGAQALMQGMGGQPLGQQLAGGQPQYPQPQGYGGGY